MALVTALGDIAIHMDGFEINKIAGAVLTAMLVIASGKTVMDITMQKHKPEKAGWALPVTEVKAKAAEPEAPFDAKAVLSTAAEGERGEWPGRLQEVPCLSYPRQGWPEPRRSQSLGCRWTKNSADAGLQLFGWYESSSR